MTADGPVGDRLRRIEAVTDAALGHLGVEELLAELLDRVRELLAVDTAAVLLLEASGQYLVATAARGIEEEVRQGVRIPLGGGFAGRIAAQKRPVTLEHVDHSNVLNPILREKGIRSLLGVPLMSGGEALGVLHVGSLSTRRFTQEETELLGMAADRVALAVRSRQVQVSRAAAGALQRSLLPAALPAVPGLEIATRYVPGGGGEVGGDWYDVFELPSGGVCVVVGDVAGRGLAAAATMGRFRAVLRAHALQTENPAELLQRLDVHVRHFEGGAMATVLCVVLSPSHDRAVVSTAGHPPPVSTSPDAPAEVVDLPPDLPIGVDAGRARRSTELPLPPGHGLFLYTDGLIERRGLSLDVGLDRLCWALRPGPADAVCGKVMFELLGADRAADDVAVLMLSRLVAHGTEPLLLRLPAAPAALEQVRSAVRRWLSDVGAAPGPAQEVVAAVGEASAHVVEHAYGPGGGELVVRLVAEPGAIVAVVRDHGRRRVLRGRRGALLRELVDEVVLERLGDGTRVTLRKSVPVPPATNGTLVGT
ncbi:ATP-binding SpoIIE family protein phosphatase [Pseudonocardia kunmingensis]|uniref:Histidine kinase-like protein n=1 Tax=Pseudonocardia kunmingensis TaxID=630975 RepID=A0A543DN51_9PSEU|nr:SpoIIE family protein phosphatase [Pseudonocardia kunmingensis]TQM10705.1 histidine kinase-like protein [Pseudonocardia kunmingensis]